MSSYAVRQAINAAVTAAAEPARVYDLSDYQSISDVLDGLRDTEKVVLIQYVIANNEIQNIAGEGNQGWREDGSVTLHIMTPIGFPSDDVVHFGESIVNEIMGYRISPDVTIESMTPFSDFGNAATGNNTGLWKGWAATMIYVKRDCK